MSDYYLRKYIGFLLLEEAKNREFCFLPAFRLGKLRSLDELKNYLELINWDKKKQSMYISCARLKDIPDFTFNLRTRRDFTHKWFDDEFEANVISSDIFFDFDSKDDLGKAKQDASVLKEFLDEYKVPYTLNFSGSKGFHIVIDGKYAPIAKIEEGCVFPHKPFIENVKKILKLETLDLANVHLANRLRKLPYSLVVPKKFKDTPEVCPEQLMNVALPLDDFQFDNFKIEDMILCNVLKKVQIIRRGNLERYSNLSLEEKKRTVLNIMKEFRAL